jgi:Fur family transcriptional regulator, ferric uptake regulator
MNPAVDEAQRRLDAFMRERGLKHTRQRDEILGAFFLAGGHVSVDDLLGRVQERMAGVGYATVYRTMKLFVEAGVAHERHFKDGQTRYEPVIDDEHHDHLICTVCGMIFEFEDPLIEQRQSEIARERGLRVESHRHEIYGSCAAPESCEHRKARAALG